MLKQTHDVIDVIPIKFKIHYKADLG